MIHAFRSDVEPNREQLESLIMRERERVPDHSSDPTRRSFSLSPPRTGSALSSRSIASAFAPEPSTGRVVPKPRTRPSILRCDS